MRRVYIAAAAVFLLDQATKLWIVQGLRLHERMAIDVLPPYLNLRMAWNYGVNFGLLSDSSPLTRWALIAVALVLSGWVLWWMHREPRPLGRISGGILIGGAIGNVVDRLTYGAVADFLNMSCCGLENPFSFNVADIAIFAGAAGLILFTGERKKTP